MARPLRIQYKGALYHVICRGNDRREIFLDDDDRKTFLKILEDSLSIYTVDIYCYVLMDNHFHLFLATPLGNLSEFMRQFNISYTSYFNRKYNRPGHLYQGRYSSILVDKENYALMLSRYIHLNPIRTREMENAPPSEKEKLLRNHRWSSLHGYRLESKKEAFLDYSLVLGPYGGNNQAGRKAYWKAIRADISKGIELQDKVVAQSILGTDEFIKWINDTFLTKEARELPAIKRITSYIPQDKIIQAICEETGNTAEEILSARGTLRQVAMELLYRLGGLKGTEIGQILGVDYSTVSQGRRRLRQKLAQDKDLAGLMQRIETTLSMINI